MKALILLAITVLSGCASMTPGERKTAMIVGGVVVTAVVLSSGGGSDNPEPPERCVVAVGPNAGGRTCL